MASEQLEAIVISHMSEVLAILYKDATSKWAHAHLQVAKADGDIKFLEATIMHLQTVIRNFQKENPHEDPL